MSDVGCPQTTILPSMDTINNELATRVVARNSHSRGGTVVGVGVAVVAAVVAVAVVDVAVAVVVDIAVAAAVVILGLPSA